MLCGLLELIACAAVKIFPDLGFPNLNPVGHANDHGFPFDAYKVFQKRRDNESALPIGNHLDSARKKQTIEITRFLFGEGHVLEFLLLRFPLFFTEHKKAFVQAARHKEFLNSIFFGDDPESGRKDESAFSVNRVRVLAVEHADAPSMKVRHPGGVQNFKPTRMTESSFMKSAIKKP